MHSSTYVLQKFQCLNLRPPSNALNLLLVMQSPQIVWKIENGYLYYVNILVGKSMFVSHFDAVVCDVNKTALFASIHFFQHDYLLFLFVNNVIDRIK